MTTYHDKKAARLFIDAARKAGAATIDVFTSDWEKINESQQFGEILDAMLACDDVIVRCKDAAGVTLGKLLVVLGNGPGETFADWSVTPFCEQVMREVQS
jgi:hypothetical protein